MHRFTRRAAMAAAAGLATAALVALLLMDAGPAAAANTQIYPSPSPVTTVMPTTVATTPAVATATTPAASPTTATPTPTTPTATPSTPTPAPTTPPAGMASIKLASAGSLGTILTDGANGLTLYVFGADTAGNGASACYTACATNWPPLLTAGIPAAPAGLSKALGVITRTDGTQQVTLGGMPLYLFKFDKAPGDTVGQGINAFGGLWSVATASGVPPTSAAPAKTPAAPSTGSGVANSDSNSLLGLSLAAALLLIVSASAGLAVVRRRQ